jgi:hypothetical protein
MLSLLVNKFTVMSVDCNLEHEADQLQEVKRVQLGIVSRLRETGKERALF